MMTKILSLGGRLRMAAACPDANAPLLAEAADAIEQHEAFKQEVSDAVEAVRYFGISTARLFQFDTIMSRFIIPKPKPDPLVDVLADTFGASLIDADELRAAMEARGLEIREKGKCR
jgi:hypothetical protein